MAEITATQVKTLREQTGAGFMDCKKALAECQGDVDQALDFLRQKGLAKAQKRAGKDTAEGLIGNYIHSNGKIGVMVEINCETDFVARTDEFGQLVRDISMHIAAAAPACITREEVSSALLDKEREIFAQQAREQGKPEKIIENIVNGKIDKYYQQTCLMEQSFVKDPDKTVQDIVTEAVAKLGENILVKRFSRFQMGEATAA